MRHSEYPHAGENTERRLLAALCSPAVAGEMRATIIDQLAAHKFVDASHAIVFEAIAKIPRAPAEHIRETLSAQVTRMGFPDLDVESILELPPPSPQEIRTLLQQLSR